jgi:NADP-dependent 3-hydroxy acid dehydrogenase YdfG
VAQAFAQVERNLGPVGILVNCAGISPTIRRKVEDINPDLWDDFIDTNLRGTFLTCREALPGMKERGYGVIVNIGSTGAHIARANVSVYAASKFAVRALTDSLIEETDGSGVRICLVSAGPINTPFWETFTGTPPMRLEEMLQPDDLADAAIWLIERPANVRVDEILLRPYAPTPQTAREIRT